MSEFSLSGLDAAIEKSASVVLEFQLPNGAYPASPNFNVYKYCWFRDGSFIADGMSRAGRVESAEKFFAWCSKIITNRRDHILNGGRLDARYTYEGEESNEAWDTYQLDGYGTFLWAMKQHSQRHGLSIDRFQDAAGLTQHYLATHWREPCSDWWEERHGIHAASLACIYAGLHAYDHPEAQGIKTAIELSNERVDASLLACVLFDAVDQHTFAPMLRKIESELVSPDGGVYRYRDDTYYGGGEWPVLAGMLGWYYSKLGRTDDARQKLAWILNQMQPNGWIREQVQSHLLHPEKYDEWIQKWGDPANPLLWSQAMMLTLASELRKLNER